MGITKASGVALYAVLTFSLGCLSVRADDLLSSGHWRVLAGESGPVETRYRGGVLFRGGSLIGFEPGWNERRFTMSGANVQILSESATWGKEETDNQTARLSLSLTPHSCSLVLDTTAERPGPAQFSIEILPEAVRTQGERWVFWVNGSLRILDMGSRFQRIPGIHELRFEQETRTVSIRCDSFELQDRRQNGQGLCLIKVMDAGGEAPRVFSASLEVSIEEYGDDLVDGRSQMLSQTMETVRTVPLSNPGFESESFSPHWETGALATIDRTSFHGGLQAARLHVSSPDVPSENVYIVQRIPVQEGRFYQAEGWVRTEDVESAVVAGMPCAGAVVIIEFADRNGKWFASGSYSPGIFGSSEWTLARTERVRAPEGSGFAILFLGLRALGTAWFDDVALDRTDESVILREPLPGSVLEDNTPAFDWVMERRTWSALDLSRDPEFPAGECLTVSEVELSPFSIAEPIEEGTWYWRVTVPERGIISPVWSFTQTAPLDSDTTPPKIEADHRWLHGDLEAFGFQVQDESGLKEVHIEIDSEPVSSLLQREGSVFRYVPSVNWKTGLHEVVITATDKKANCSTKRVFLTHSKSVPETVWRVEGGMRIGQEDFYPLAMYGVRIEDMAEIAAAGFNLVHNYRWDGNGTNAEALEYLDAAERHGLKAFIGFDRQRLMAGDEQFVAERVAALMGHPALLAWYLYDEPDIPSQYVSVMWLGRYYRLIKALDPHRPVIVTCAFDDAAREYRAAYDVHWTQVYNGTQHVAKRLLHHRGLLGEDTPLLGILSCHDRAQTAFLRQGKPADPGRFGISAERMRADAFTALVRGSSGLAWWWWGQGSPRYYTVSDAPSAWEHLKKVIADIRSLEPLLIKPGRVRVWTESDAEGRSVLAWSKRLSDRTLIIAVNPGETEVKLEMSVEDVVPDGTLDVLFEDRNMKVSDGRFEERFASLGVHVYEDNH